MNSWSRTSSTFILLVSTWSLLIYREPSTLFVILLWNTIIYPIHDLAWGGLKKRIRKEEN